VVKELFENDVYIPLLEDQKRFLILYGGGGSGKSVFAAHKIILRTVGELGHKFLALRKVGDTVKDSIFAELEAATIDLGVGDEFRVNKTDRTFTHLLTGNQILCKGLDDVRKMKSIKGITGMWLEEATDFDEDDLDQLNIRIRGEKPNYVQIHHLI
jgi:phage terminase large subunit